MSKSLQLKNRATPPTEYRAPRTLTRKQQIFLNAYAYWGTAYGAQRATGVSRQSHHKWLRENEAYAAASVDAYEQSIQRLETEAIKRAEKGTLKPIYWQGKRVGLMREYSDTLMIFMLKAARPDIYRDRVEYTGRNGGPIQHEHKVAGIFQQILSKPDGIDRLAGYVEAVCSSEGGAGGPGVLGDAGAEKALAVCSAPQEAQPRPNGRSNGAGEPPHGLDAGAVREE